MRRTPWASTVALLLALAPPGTAADSLPDSVAARLAPVIPAAIDYYNSLSDDPLLGLGADQVSDLLAGEVVRIRRHPDRGADPDPPERVTGYRLVPSSRDVVWIAALDPSLKVSDLLTEARLSPEGVQPVVWHQYVSLPWPVADRQWVIRVDIQDRLAASSDDLLWEMRWNLVEDGPRLAAESIAAGNLPGIDSEKAHDAVYVPRNAGSWVLFRLEDDVTLLAYRVVASVGGHIPDSWIATFAMAQLESLLDTVAKNALIVRDHYDPEKSPVIGGDGTLIGHF
jgi:hypothetical protein